MNDDDDLGVGSLGGANEEDDGGWDAMNLEQVSVSSVYLAYFQLSYFRANSFLNI